jgi:hypothetical protein
MIIQGQIGALATTSSLPAGQQAVIRQGNMGDMIVSELHGRYYEAAYRRTMFSASSTAAGTTVAGNATGITGSVVVSNPINSPVNVAINKIFAGLAAAGAAGFLALSTGFNSGTNVTHTTPLTVRNNYFGVGAAGYAFADAAATLPTAPTYYHMLGGIGTLAATGFGLQQNFYVDLEGSLILPPGGYALFTTSAIQTTAFIGSIQWEEIPL